MRTEIVVPFAIDTAPMEERIREHGEEEVMKILRETVERNLISCVPEGFDYYGNSNGKPNWSKLMRDCFMEWLDEHVEEITDEAALLMARRGSSRKRWRDVLKEVKEERGD